MGAVALCWLIASVSITVAIGLAVTVWMQWVRNELQQEELVVLRELLRNLGEVISRQEAENRELSSGLRAEKAHVAQIKRQCKLSASE